MITTQLVALDIIRGAGGTPIPPVPVPNLPPGGVHHKARKQRRYVKLKDGRQFELENEHDLELILRQIVEERQDQPRKAKVSKKIRPRVKAIERIADNFDEFVDWNSIYQHLQAVNEQVLTENLLLRMVQAAIIADQEEDEESTIIMLLM